MANNKCSEHEARHTHAHTHTLVTPDLFKNVVVVVVVVVIIVVGSESPNDIRESILGGAKQFSEVMLPCSKRVTSCFCKTRW